MTNSVSLGLYVLFHTMQTKSFLLPVVGGEQVEAEINEWLLQRVVVSKQSELREIGGALYWVLLFFYMLNGAVTNAETRSNDGSATTKRNFAKRKDIDYRDMLSLDDFAVYTTLRDVRSEIQQKEGCPAYVICTNAQLSEMVLTRCATLEDLKHIKGFGDARVQKYGKNFLDALKKGFEARNISIEVPKNATSSQQDDGDLAQDSPAALSEPPFDFAMETENDVPSDE